MELGQVTNIKKYNKTPFDHPKDFLEVVHCDHGPNLWGMVPHILCYLLIGLLITHGYTL
jgi:hypothetical protein